jgi:hypothetical protein
LGWRDELDDRLGDDAEGALAADHELLEVVAGDVLGELAAEPDDLAGGGDELQAEDVAAGDAVLDGLAAAGVLRDVAADLAGLHAHGVAGEEQAVLGTRGARSLVTMPAWTVMVRLSRSRSTTSFMRSSERTMPP